MFTLDDVPHPIGTPTAGVTPNTGPLATAAWLVAHDLVPQEPRWHLEVILAPPGVDPEDEAATALRVELFSEEWGYCFRHDRKVSWIRVTDLPFVHGRDDHGLLPHTPALRSFGTLVARLEERFGIQLAREPAALRTSLRDAEAAIRAWIRGW